MKRFAILVVAIGCGGGKGGDPDDPAACTPDGQEVVGTAVTFETVDLGFTGGSPSATHLITSTDQLAADFGTPPPEFDDVDFATDRIVLGSSNPALRFVVLDAGGDLAVGEEPLCQGVAPSTVGYVLRGITSDVLAVIGCPYTGPDPCLAP